MKRIALALLLLASGCVTPPGGRPGEVPEDAYELRCVVGSPRTSSWRIGEARFRAHYCASSGGSGTTAFHVVRLTVADGDKQPVTFDDKTLASSFLARYNHLNACDSFRLKLDGVTFAGTGPANAGCGPVVEDAPARTFADRNPATLVRVRRSGGDWQNFEMPCGHWLFECGP